MLCSFNHFSSGSKFLSNKSFIGVGVVHSYNIVFPDIGNGQEEISGREGRTAPSLQEPDGDWGCGPKVQKPPARHGRQGKSVPRPGRSGPTTVSSAGPSGLPGGGRWRGHIHKPFRIRSFSSHHFLLLHPNTGFLTEKHLQQMQAVTSTEMSKL